MSQQVNLGELFEAYKREDEVITVPAGLYTLEVLRATVRNGNKGQGIMPIYKVLEGPYAGKTIMAGQFTASEAGRSIFFRQMKGFGFDENFFRMVSSSEDPMKATAQAMVGRVVKAQITVRQWQGQDRNNINIGGITLVRAGTDPLAAGLQGGAPSPVAAAPAPAPVAAPAPEPVQQAPVAEPVQPQPQPEQPPQQQQPQQTTAVPPMPPLPIPGGPAF